jgi:hypothetical protein
LASLRRTPFFRRATKIALVRNRFVTLHCYL